MQTVAKGMTFEELCSELDYVTDRIAYIEPGDDFERLSAWQEELIQRINSHPDREK